MNETRLLERFLEFVQINSETKNEKAFAEHLIPILEGMGMQVSMDDVGEKVGSNAGNLLAKLKGNAKAPTLMFSSHMDTVTPGVGIRPQIRDGVIYSDGTTILGADDKAGIAAILEGVQTVQEEGIPHGDIELLFTIYEEGGLLGSKYFDYSKVEAKLCYVLDSGGSPGKITVGGPSQAKIEAEFIGKAAHAGVAPEEGISAVQMMAEAIANMKLLRIDEETTANIGLLTAGQVTNIVTPSASFVGEARSLDDDKLNRQIDHMREVCESAARKYGGNVQFISHTAYKAFDVDVNSAVVQNAIKAFKNMDIEAVTMKSGGGSDTSNYNENGISSVNLSIGETKPHTLEESISIQDLNDAARMVVELIKVNA
ncbi:MAG: M20/M25/M40 family metallo-hydrolase [Tissierellia bacterium]|nr:M20/M25/M40 family metallo-hydrolase [Tissierellia bacterium]